MKYNRKIFISSAGNRKSKIWQKEEILWSDFVEKLSIPVRSTETLNEYMSFAKSKQDDLKDVGGFVGGTFKGNRRKADYVETRDLITLDLDAIKTNGADDVIKKVSSLGCSSVIYSTRKHSDYAPRLRVIIPLNRSVSADEYEPIARKIGDMVGMNYCDPTTFQASRLMHYPSCSSDSTYVYEVFDKGFADADSILSMYEDWRDITKWPQVHGAAALEKKRAAKQENPLDKRGVVGAFCRTYTIYEAMEKFIPGLYEPSGIDDRYTYIEGSTSGGAIIYSDGLFMYSHHATDPCSATLVNAFDMVRLHKFGHMDDNAKEGTPAAKMPSYVAMGKLASQDKKVNDLIARERLEQAREVFSDEDNEEVKGSEDNLSWQDRLTKDQYGKIEKTINNAVIILENDKLIKDKIAIDEFSSSGVILGSLPWDKRDEKRRWQEADDANFYNYMEVFYGLTGRDKLDNALMIISERKKINDVKAYLESLKWDGVKRVDTLLIDYLGAEDTEYSRIVIRKFLVAAVARAVVGGIKFDYMPILIGGQGVGKSTFISNLGREWFSDSLTSFEGKESAELIQGTWINEIGELTAMNRHETNAVKQFLSKKDDIYRAAYGRRTNKYPRRCVFIGTSNEVEVLKDQTGNRRFWPVDVGVEEPTKNVWEDMPKEIDQIWAEAFMYYRLGEKLFLDKRQEQMALEHQEAHRFTSEKEGLIRQFLEEKVPSNWEKLNINQRRAYISNKVAPEGTVLVKRTKICALEIWCELFGGDQKYLQRKDSVEINQILASITNLKKVNHPERYGPYGSQRGFRIDRLSELLKGSLLH